MTRQVLRLAYLENPRCRASTLPLTGTLSGLALRVTINTPPNSMGRLAKLALALASASIFGAWVQAPQNAGLPMSRKKFKRQDQAGSSFFSPGALVEFVCSGAAVLCCWQLTACCATACSVTRTDHSL